MKTNHDLESIFAQAIELADPTHRGKFLDDACEGDLGLRNRVGRLLSANQRAVAFMSEPAAILNLNDRESLPAEKIGEQPGDHVGRYKLLQQIGEGGMGTVFMAEQTQPVHRKVALKIVKPGLDTKEVIARFESERQALALMNHANIARVLDAGATQNGRPYFVMELVKGIPITEYCNEAKLTPRQRLELFVPICRALQHAHQKGIIHRDIKPTNVMVTLVDGKPVPKVIDFGIAKAISHRLTEKTLFTRYGEFIGTPAYMSPEQAAISGIDVDTRSDVYSLGALLYELLAGVPPFDKEKLQPLTHDELRRFIREETPRQPSDAIGNAISTAGSARTTTIAQARSSTPRDLKSQLNGELDWIVMRALEKDRGRRYETASSFADDVVRYLNNDTVVARPATLGYRWKKSLSRNRTLVAALSAIAATLVLATCVSSWMAYATIQARNGEARVTATLQEHVDFMNAGLFAQADPLSEPNRNVKLRTILDRSAQALANQPIKKPAVEAAIRSTIGETYRGLGEYETALLHLRRSHQICVTEYGASHRKTIEAGNKLANVLLALAKYDEAKPLLRDQLAAAETLSSEDELLLNARRLTASRLEAIGEHEAAEKLLRQLLNLRQKSFGNSHPETFKAMANLAFVLQSQQRYDEALRLLTDAHQGMLQANDQWHPAALKITSNLASLHSSRDERDMAEEIFETTLPKLERLLGAEHPQTLTAKHSLAILRFSDRRVGESERMLLDVLKSQRDQLGESHPSTLTTMHNLAIVQKSLGKFSDAESLLKTELESRRKSQGPGHEATRNALSSLSFFYLDQAQFEEAIPYYERLTASTGDANPLDATIAMTMLGLCRHKTGDHAQAKANLEAALDDCESSYADHWLAYIIKSLLGEVYLNLDQRNDAEEALHAGYEGLRLHSVDTPRRWKPMGLRAATRRLAEFYESEDSDDQRSRATQYRNELKTLYADVDAGQKTSRYTDSQTEQIGNTEDGDPN